MLLLLLILFLQDVFPQDIPYRLPPLKGIEYRIDLTFEVTLPNSATYRTNLKDEKEIQKQVAKLLEKRWCKKQALMLGLHFIPQLDDLLDELHGSILFSKIDLKSGYHQIRLIIPFGLTNTPSTFMRLMNHILRNLIGKCVVVYFDDMLIYSTCLNDYLLHVKNKCVFCTHEVVFLDFVVGSHGVKVDEEKVKVI
ncbi:Retrovirus-related Pol polyprotein from transposon 17.6, partial [Mucuna pruriens]